MKYYFIILTMLLGGCASGPCKGVIGAGYSTWTGVVDQVYPGSPAQQIGVEIGDTLMRIDKWSGYVGDVVVVEWTHNGIKLSHSATLVCVDKFREEW